MDPIPIPLHKGPRNEGLPPLYSSEKTDLLQNPLNQLINKQDLSDTKTDIEENSPFQENIISKIYERPDQSYFREPVELIDLIDTKNIIQ